MGALLIALVIGITLAAFLDLTGSQHRATVRASVWNATIPMAEAGLEEALTHAYVNHTNLASHGWALSASGLAMSNGVTLPGPVFYKFRRLGEGGYLAAISNGPTPTITVQGHLPQPLNHSATLARTIRVRTVGGAVFARGMVARGNITWNGQIQSDSFDSQDPLRSTGGRYDPALRGDNGSVGAVEGNLSLGSQGKIYGRASTGPTGTIATGPGAAVGDLAFIGGGGTGIQAGHADSDLNVSFPDVSVPFTSTTLPPGGYVTNHTIVTNTTAVTSLSYPTNSTSPVVTNSATSTTYPAGTTFPVTTNVVATAGKGKSASTTYTTNYTHTSFAYTTNSLTTNVTTAYYDHILDSGDYYLSGLNNVRMFVRGNARLHVDGNVSQSAGSAITVASIATLQMWVSGSISFSGNATVNNTGDALRLRIYGLPTCTSASFSGNGEFTGLLYAPRAHLTYNGGGSDSVDYMGAAIVGSAEINGKFAFHYDENVGRNGPTSAYILDSWVEL
jgi:hypothetical protein